MTKGLSEGEILEHLSRLAIDENTAANYRIKALELLGKAKNMFREEEKGIIGTVKIVDDIP